jgi:hypothetical protein
MWSTPDGSHSRAAIRIYEVNNHGTFSRYCGIG